MITLEHITKTYTHQGRTINALDDVTLTIEQGEIFGVVGQSGAGKSTLIRSLVWLDKVERGKVL